MQRLTPLLLLLIFSGQLYAQHLEWITSQQEGSASRGDRIAVDGNGDVIVIGIFSGTKDIEDGPGETIVTSNGEDDVFVQKTTNEGDFVWGISYGNSEHDWVYGIETDTENNIYICGFFTGTIDFDPGDGIENRTAVHDRDAYVLKLSPAGEFLWVYTVGGFRNDIAYDVNIDAFGVVNMIGTLLSEVDMDMGPDEFILDNSNGNLFLLKITSDAEFIDARIIASSVPYPKFTFDSENNIILTGSFSWTYDFDPGVDEHLLTVVGGKDIFVSKLTNSGDLIWAKSFGGGGDDIATNIAVNNDGEVFVTGYFDGFIFFDYGIFDYTLFPAGERDAFIFKLDADGILAWARRLGGESRDVANTVEIDDAGNVFFGGYFRGLADVHPSPIIADYYDTGRESISGGYFEKLDTYGNLIWSKIYNFAGTTVNDTYRDDDGNIYFTGTTNGTHDYDTGPREHFNTTAGTSSFILKLSDCGISEYTRRDTACYSYTVDSGDETYYESGIYNDTILGDGGCDLFLTIELEIRSNESTSIAINECISYTPEGADTTYFESGVHADTLTNIYGCDSIIITNFEINDALGTEVNQTDFTLTAVASGLTYQWVDCNASYAEVIDETDPNYTPTTNGSYAVIISDGVCTDTSACFEIAGLSTESIPNRQYQIYPNPSQGLFHIKSPPGDYVNSTIYIKNIMGKTIKSTIIGPDQNIELDIASGIYFIEVALANEIIYTQKLIVQ
ncbi:T9SS type A sorting domain-containing protein [Crocinitomix catalasitica]|uniref:T9SS type A sorting domain-containing protein n=1 Tax=Crocinitomix catalasitica TaxID=184607 RepID=UPI0004880C6A|nr:T9SS type A sorting domain-containing protein [Crocinitomix catalasitica]